jgi:hypothetical protein
MSSVAIEKHEAAPPAISEMSTQQLHGLLWYSTAGCRELTARLRELSDEELQQTIKMATDAREHAYILRGACVCEAERRVAEREERDGKRSYGGGRSRTAEIKELGRETGVDPRTLRDDALIVRTFYPSVASEENVDLRSTFPAPTPGVPRSVYLAAAKDPEPHAAIRIAEKRAIEQGAVSLQEFMNDRRAILAGELTTERSEPAADGTGPSPSSVPASEDTEWLNVPISRDAMALIARIMHKGGFPTPGTAVEHAIRETWRALAYSRKPEHVRS